MTHEVWSPLLIHLGQTNIAKLLLRTFSLSYNEDKYLPIKLLIARELAAV